MRKKLLMTIVLFVTATMFTFSNTTEAASTKVMWGNMELKKGQIGRVTILKDTPLLHIGNDPSVDGGAVRALKKGEVYRVYSTKTPQGYYPMYALGDNLYVIQNSEINGVNVKYETPSKSLLNALKTKVMWGNMELKKGQIGRVTILKDTPLLHIGKDPSVDGGAVRTLKKGEVYRVYSTNTPEGYSPMYNVGGEYYVIQNSELNGINVKYETPSKSTLALLH